MGRRARGLILLGTLVTVMGVLVACGATDDTPPTPTTAPTEIPAATEEPTAEEEATPVVEAEATPAAEEATPAPAASPVEEATPVVPSPVAPPMEATPAVVTEASPAAPPSEATPVVAAEASPVVGTEATPAAATPEATPLAATPLPATPEATPSPAEGAGDGDLALVGDVARGRTLSSQCIACHSIDGSPMVGPTWLGLYGSEVELEDGTTVIADETYLAESILDPMAKIVKGYPPAMPPYAGILSDQDVADIIAYIRSLDESGS